MEKDLFNNPEMCQNESNNNQIWRVVMNRNTINRLVAGSIPAGPTMFIQHLLNYVFSLPGIPAILETSASQQNSFLIMILDSGDGLNLNTIVANDEHIALLGIKG
jgi:hypothetical protein